MTKKQLKNTLVWLGQEENRDALKLVLLQLKYLLHHSRFRRMKGNVVFGFEDPYTVGRILGLLSIFYPIYGEQVSIRPVYDEQILEGKLSADGHIRLIHLLLVLIRLYRNPAIRKQMKQMMA